jgi:Tol biopolymer transport system component
LRSYGLRYDHLQPDRPADGEPMSDAGRSREALLAEALVLEPSSRAAFLERACGPNLALRRELETLLTAAAAGERSGGRSGPWLAGLGLAPGQTVGPYRLEASIGRGGMGEVFKAFDPRLRRWVALKTILVGASGSPEALGRFEREMRTLAALDHPNILRIHDAGEQEGMPYAVTELLSGESLADLLARGRLPLERARELARQFARGLAAAHAAGIVHRDLKPHNLFVTADGTLKILDFGVAKFLPGPNSGSHTDLTVLGEALGTPQYMAPEQARGEPCDHRVDLFAFGAILYEMLTGERAFPGETFANVLHAVLYGATPDLLARCPAAGTALADLVRRCLDKEPEGRPAAAAELLATLEARDGRDTAPTNVLTPPTRVRRAVAAAPAAAWPRRVLTYGGTALAAAAIAILAGRAWMPRAPSPRRLEYLTDSSRDWAPSLSGDGKWIAYVSDRDGTARLWVHQMATGEERALADGAGEPDFDAQSDTVLFTRDEPAGVALYSVGLLAGEPRRLLGGADLGAWSPDGTRLAVARQARGVRENRFSLGLAAVDGSGARELFHADAPIRHLRWSRDGRRVFAVVAGSTQGRGDELVSIDAESGKATPVGLDGPAARLSRPALTAEGRTLFIAASESLTGYAPASRIVAVDLRSGRATTELWVPAAVSDLELEPSGGLVFDAATVAQSLRELILVDGGARWGRWLTRGRALDREPTALPDGSTVVFSSNRGGGAGLWAWSASSGRLRRLAPHAADDWDPFVARDGHSLLWSSNRSGELEIWTAGVDGDAPHRLSQGSAPAENPSQTADGRWIFYSSAHPRQWGLRRMLADGSADQPVATGKAGRAHPEVSPDGRFILVHDYMIDGVSTLRAVDTATGQPTAFAVRMDLHGHPLDGRVTLGRAHWRPDGRAVAFVGLREDGSVSLFEQGFDALHDTAATRRELLPAGADELPESFTYVGDGTRLVVSLVERASTIMAARHG